MKKVLFLCFFGSIPSLFLCIAMYIYDPLQLYHLPYFREKNILSTNMRYQSAGLIHSWDFDSIILGSSILQNTSSKEAREKLGGNWINLSMKGATLYERDSVFWHTLQHKKISQIIISLEPFLFLDKENTLQGKKSFYFLHDKDHYNDFQIYLNEKYILCMLKVSNICIQETKEEFPTAWFLDEIETLGGFNKWINRSNAPHINKTLQLIMQKNYNASYPSCVDIQKMLKTTIIGMIKQNPHTTFIIILPPFSTLYKKIKLNFNGFEKWKKGIMLILNYHFNNVKIYGFDNDSFADDINRYSSLTHYDEKVNSFMLDAIKNDTHRITLENVDSYFEEMRKKVEAYDIEPLRKQIIESGVLNH